MKKLLIIMFVSGFVITSCTTQKKETTVNMENPFFTTWTTPFGVPPFDEIKEEHFIPAIEEGIKQHQAEIDAIVAGLRRAHICKYNSALTINRVFCSIKLTVFLDR
jgi:peptidyl-dipeptidase Dcp